MKILSSNQIRIIDRFTIENEPVDFIDLMERAAKGLFNWIRSGFNAGDEFYVFAGPGNNGGDGLVLARLLIQAGYKCRIFILKVSDNYSEGFTINRKRLVDATGIIPEEICSHESFPSISNDVIIIDAIFGSGLTRSPDGISAGLIKFLNKSSARIISIDMPSGLMDEGNPEGSFDTIVRATCTLCFEFPRLSFMFPEYEEFTGEWHILKIGLHPEAIESAITPYFFLQREMIAVILKNRKRFSHKGCYGHGLLAGGSYGKIGAIALGAKAAIRSGIGLLTCCVPGCGYEIIQTVIPEAMCMTDENDQIISEIICPEYCNALAAGPGMGTALATQEALLRLIDKIDVPLVLDADALNILALNPGSVARLPKDTIITPHPKEFERLAGKSENSSGRLKLQMDFAAKTSLIVILKGANTSVALPDGRVFFNSTGNPGMATGGCGDVLTGVLLSLLAQGYCPAEAAIAGVYLHGLAGDLAAESAGSYEALAASDIPLNLGKAFSMIRR